MRREDGRRRPPDRARRDSAIYANYCSDPAATYRRLGERYGVSHERVRQIIERHGLADAKAARTEARSRAERSAALEEFALRASRARPCVICGCWVLRGNGSGRTCSPGCGAAYRTSGVRFAIDPIARFRHRRAMARYWLRSGSPAERRHGARILAGLVEPKGRWHLPGSRTAEVIKRACPDKLPPPAGSTRGTGEGVMGRDDS